MPFWNRRPDADERMASAKSLVKAILNADGVLPMHRDEFIRLALYKVTEAEGGKYGTRYRSEACRDGCADPHHDHVIERAKLKDALLAEPDRTDDLLDQAIGCTVTAEEHKVLTEASRRDPRLEGWDRYRAARVRVVDTLTGKRVV